MPGYDAQAEAIRAYQDVWNWDPYLRLTAEDLAWLTSIGVQP